MNKELDQYRSLFIIDSAVIPTTEAATATSDVKTALDAKKKAAADEFVEKYKAKISAAAEYAFKKNPGKDPNEVMKEVGAAVHEAVFGEIEDWNKQFEQAELDIGFVSLLEDHHEDHPTEDTECDKHDDSEQDREKKEQMRRALDSWFQSKTASFNAKLEELKLKYPENIDRIKSSFEKWLKLTEAADDEPESDDPPEADPEAEDTGDDKTSDDEPASESDVDATDDPPEGADPEDDSILSGMDDAGGVEDESDSFTDEEIEIIDDLIESEVDAHKEYGKALNETTNETARRIFTEIMTDENKHLVQLQWLRSKAKGKEYDPHNKDAMKEIESIVESTDPTSIL